MGRAACTRAVGDAEMFESTLPEMPAAATASSKHAS